ncbi:MAG: peptidoglycan-binding protein [Acidimicrobiia bacterium]|nr:peptidoglycan-binding protein [Acidimicrobiia bacterium]
MTDVDAQGGFPTIRTGDCGPPVSDLLRRLVDAGFEPSAAPPPAGATPDPDRVEFGDGEERLVRAFQESRNLAVDGVVGPATWEALLEAGWRLGDRVLYDRRPWLRGDDISELQSQLGALGFDIGKIDGIYGPLARRAVEEFQRNCGLRPDGIAGPATLRMLRRVSGAPAGKPNLAVRERLHVRTHGTGIAGRRVFIDPRPGRDSADSGVDDVVERDFTYAAALALAAELKARGAHPLVSRGPENDPTPSDRASTANWFGADIVVTLGVSDTDDVVIAHFGTHRWESPAGAGLAAHLGSAVAEALGATVGPGLASTDPLLRETRAIAALVRIPLGGRDQDVLVADLALALCRGFEAFLLAEDEEA